MKKHLFLLVCIALFAGLLPAQKDDFPAVVIASQGKVRYIPADNSGELKITSGMAVKKTGIIKITGNGSAVSMPSRTPKLRARSIVKVSRNGLIGWV